MGRHVALCRAFGYRVAVRLGYLPFAPLLARVCGPWRPAWATGCSTPSMLGRHYRLLLALTDRLNILPNHLSEAAQEGAGRARCQTWGARR